MLHNETLSQKQIITSRSIDRYMHITLLTFSLRVHACVPQCVCRSEEGNTFPIMFELKIVSVTMGAFTC